MFGYKSAKMGAHERLLKNEVERTHRRVEVAGNWQGPRPSLPVVLVDRQTTYPAMHYLGIIR